MAPDARWLGREDLIAGIVACAYGLGLPPALVLPRLSGRLSIHTHQRKGRVATAPSARALIAAFAGGNRRICARPSARPCWYLVHTRAHDTRPVPSI